MAINYGKGKNTSNYNLNTPGAQCAKLIANASATFMLTKNVERM